MGKLTQSWDRRPAETDTQWSYFQAFRSMAPPRHLGVCAESLHRSYRTIEKYSTQHDWFARSNDWDEHLAHKADDAIVSEVEKMAREHLDAAKRARVLGTSALARYLKMISKSDNDPVVSARDALALVEKGITLERLIIGEATDRTETRTVDVDLSRLNAEKAARLLELLEEAGCLPKE